MFNLSGRVAFVTDEVSEIDLNTNNLLAKFETKVVLTILIGGKGVALQEITNL
jgi:molybdopterin biosynthesis enzyme MoaB